MDKTTEIALTQIFSVLIQSFFTWLTMIGKTEEEIEVMFEYELKKFKNRDPKNLPSPPE
jgi:hypothetical protein